MNFADPKSDIAFKKVFGNENKTEILISFLNAVLDLHDEQAIVEITLLNPHQVPKISILKESNLDVRAQTRAGVSFIVEMQKDELDIYDYWAMKEAGHQDALETDKRDGRKEGFLQGMEKGIKRVALQMLHNGMSSDEIVTLTGLTWEELKNVR